MCDDVVSQCFWCQSQWEIAVQARLFANKSSGHWVCRRQGSRFTCFHELCRVLRCTWAKRFLRLAHSTLSNVVTGMCCFYGSISRFNDSQYLIVEILPWQPFSIKEKITKPRSPAASNGSVQILAAIHQCSDL